MDTWITLALLVLGTLGFVNGQHDGQCPPDSQIAPCTCIRDDIVKCSKIYGSSKLDAVFKRNPNWDFPRLVLDRCVMKSIPKSVMELANFKGMNITNSYFVSLFDGIPLKDNHIQWLVLSNVKILKGLDWKLLSMTSLLFLTVYNTTIKTFDASFRDNFRTEFLGLYLENTRTSKITQQAFSRLNYTEVISIRKCFLRKLSRDMFPKYWRTIFWFDFSYNRLNSLPEDIFDNMPNLRLVFLENNQFSTLPSNTFNIRPNEIFHLFYLLDGNPLVCDCGIKWITYYTQDYLEVFGHCAKPKEYEGRKLSSLTPKDFDYCNV